MEEQQETVSFQELKKLMLGKPVVKLSDMQNDMLSEVQDIIVSGIESFSAPILNIENACKNIKENLEKKYGPTWQVVIGEGFAYDVTVQNKTLLLMFYNGALSALVFKT